MMGTMAHLTPLARGSRDPKEFVKFLLTRGGVPKDPDHRRHTQAEEGRMTPRCPFAYDQACCMHPPFAECYAFQASSIASNLDPKLMPKEQDQITIRKVFTLILFG